MTRFLSALLLIFAHLASPAQAGTLTFDSYYHNDHLGSPVAATDERGDLLWRAHFRPYGERQEDPKGTAFGTVGYTGHTQSADSGLVYMQARYYDPLIGRFMAMDPVGVSSSSPISFNRYTYTNNNPYRYIDPDGGSAVTAFGGLLHESGQFISGNGFDGSAITGALSDGYNGEGDGFASAAFEDVTSLVPAGTAIKLLRLAKVYKAAQGVERLGDFMLANASRLNQKLGKKIGQGRLPFDKGRDGIEKAKQTVFDTLDNPSATSKTFTNSNGDRVFDVFSEKTGFTVRVREGGVFDTLIDAKTDKF